ncbi:TMAO reductase system periplasmic protein TorT (plasmid) [Rhizobium sp. TH2]|uniref:TMAO reductase system periplasmic protein TorT n=1 Tax=Rhizobium sp. TH2 TaxID=2775403 RepID=UPI002157B18E|nr:TMAO reductase system periplasmic protein TorT [Rhizobium sp. TH2]UVC12152.1 TMAO reductase system periplasmic protein TorT [Rhizobium sp. TH2]
MKRTNMKKVILSGLLALLSPTLSHATDTWPFDVADVVAGKTVSYQGLDKASKKWHICVLFPHMKDSYWVGVDYGIADQAKALGVKATIFQAGGYTEAAKQVAQYNDCVALGVDAIIIGAISEAGLAKSMAEGKAKGIVQVGVINPLQGDVADAKIYANYDVAAAAGARFLAEKFKDSADPVKLLHFPGPQGSGWAEASTEGVKLGIKDSKIELADAKYGDTGKSIQLQLVEDALQTYDDVGIIYGTAVTAEVAKQALQEAGIDRDVTIASYYSNEGIVDLVKKGDVSATVTESPVMEARIAVDLAVRILEKKEHYKHLNPAMSIVTKDNIDTIDLTRSFAPAGWKPVYSVD